jgi:BtpA family
MMREAHGWWLPDGLASHYVCLCCPAHPFYAGGGLGGIVDTAVASARALHLGGADGCLVQTVDRVYSVADDADPARVAAMSLVVRAVVEAAGGEFAVGVHMLRNAVCASLAVAKVVGGSFVRVGAGRADPLLLPIPVPVREEFAGLALPVFAPYLAAGLAQRLGRAPFLRDPGPP